ncbi:MAG: hypothetical protein V2I24_02210 [Halieaceae bacterium]|jgi:hypothetical protein|nr:hypothetical protein [Halieaceae bacterium]
MYRNSVIWAVLGLFAPGVLFAESDYPMAGSASGSPFIDPRHRVSIGIAEQDADFGIRATAGDFDPIVLKASDLGISDRDYSYYLDYRYRFRPRWAVVAGTYGFSDSGTREAERDFNYDGVEFTAGAELTTRFEVDAYLVDVMYALHRDERSELMIGGGVHALDLSASLAASIAVDEERREFRRSGTTLLAPVPNLRIAGTWVFSERFALHGLGGWLSANVDEFSGDFVYAHLRLAYALTQQMSLALGYQRTEIDITQERSNSELNYDVRLEGFTFTFALSF